MCWGGMVGMFWEKCWSLKWRARGSEDNQVEKESKSVGLEKEDAMNQARWRMGVGEIAVRPLPFTGINPDQNWIDWLTFAYGCPHLFFVIETKNQFKTGKVFFSCKEKMRTTVSRGNSEVPAISLETKPWIKNLTLG